MSLLFCWNNRNICFTESAYNFHEINDFFSFSARKKKH